jgi:hypothetical protein
MGRKPQGEVTLTGAERQARYRLRLGLAADHTPDPIAPHKLARARPLSRRWYDTVAGLVSLQADYARWFDALPEATRDTATGDALRAMVDLDLEDIIAIQPPRGFGRD